MSDITKLRLELHREDDGTETLNVHDYSGRNGLRFLACKYGVSIELPQGGMRRLIDFMEARLTEIEEAEELERELNEVHHG